jgi:hypothetical protein
VLFQFTIIASGNLSFLNWLTILPALACFDDRFWAKILPRFLTSRAQAAAENAEPSRPMLRTAAAVAALIAILSVQPLLNLVSSQQIMNTSFDPLELVNTYGAFGTVGRQRFNVVFEGTDAATPDAEAEWRPYIYKGLPVELNRRPPQIAPYQLRLDWQMWFAAMGTPNEYPWTLHLVWKLLHSDLGAVGLFAGNPFPEKPPRYIRATWYRYSFVPANSTGLWWDRERLAEWLPPLAADDPQLIELAREANYKPAPPAP